MQNQSKLFAFKLAEKQVQRQAVPATVWTVRAGGQYARLMQQLSQFQPLHDGNATVQEDHAAPQETQHLQRWQY